MDKAMWINSEKKLVDNNVSVGARVSIKALQYNKHRSINEVRWRVYQELIKNLGEYPNMEGAFYVRTWVDIDPNTQEAYLLGRITSIPIVNKFVQSVMTEPKYNAVKKLSFKDRLKILFKGEL